jgi:hypothetical protein
MKTFITFSLVVMFTIGTAFGKQIDENTAKAVGQKFLTTKTRSLNFKSTSGLILAYKAISTQSNPRSSAPEVYYYVFNSISPQGFVIIAGDDKVVPVLGYSDQKSFDLDNIPAHVAAWLEGYKNQVKYAIDNNLSSTGEIMAEWQSLSAGSGPGTMRSGNTVNPLLQTTWDQSPNYNAQCPYDNLYNERTVTGCVATAMAQVLKFWNYPTTGSGFHSYNSNNYGTLSADFGSTTYQWGSMPSSVTGPNDAVATLMYQCGVSVDMNYGVGSQGGSGAYVISSQSPVTNCSEYALKTYFGYPSTLQGIDRSAYSESQWVNILKTELDASRPIIYAGFGNGGGHCFVCDGYDQNDLFHFNWGWSGYYDGYFSINALNPGGTGTGGGTGGFNSGHQAIIGVQAPGGGGQTTTLQLYNSLQPSATTINYGQAFDIWTDLVNSGNNSFSGDFCAAVFDYNAAFVDFVQVLSTTDPLPPGYHYTNGLTFSTTGLFSMLPGTYYIAIYYRPTGGNWYLVGDNGNYNNLVQMTVINPNTIQLYEAMTVSPGTTISQGEAVSVHLDVANYGSTTFDGILDVSLYNLDGSFAYTIEEKTNVTMPPNTHFTNGLTFINSSLGAEPGTYLLAIQHQRSGGNWELTGSTSTYLNPIFITVQDAAPQADMYEPNNEVAESYLLPVTFSGNTAKVNTQGSNCNTGEDYDFYKINLDPGYSYTVSAELFDSQHEGNGKYSLDAIFSYSTDGINGSDTYDDIMTDPIIVHDGGTVYFLVSPKFTGSTGTYRLDISVAKNPLGIGEPVTAGQINVYPNPARDYFTVDLSASNGNDTKIQLLDILGKSVGSLLPADHRKQVKVPVENLPEGIYFIRIETDKGMISKEIVIRK